MDWAKAKNILIIAFIVTNILLFYVLIDNKDTEDPTLKVEFINDVKDMLLEKDIKISSEIPTKTPSLPLLTVEYETYSPEKLVNNFFREYTKEQKDNKIHFKNDKELLILDNNREIEYTNESDIKQYDNLDKEIVEKIVKDFLENREFDTDDYVLSEIKQKNDEYYLEYNKKYKDMVIEKSYMKFTVNKAGIKEFKRLWIDALSLEDNGIRVSSAPRALLRLITMENTHGKTITDIGISYYFDPDRHTQIGDPKDTKQGKAIPAWRITFDDGTKEFLEEY